MQKLAWGENAIIRSDDGQRVNYSGKCPFCGYVYSGGTITTISFGKLRSGDTCPKCHRHYDITIGRG